MNQLEGQRWRNAFWHPDQSRQITTRIVIEGDLALQTPAHFGSGDSDNLTDMPLLTALDDGKTPLLPGASIAGALRSHLRAREQGYLVAAPHRDQYGDSESFRAARRKEWTSVERQLFGGFGEDQGEAGGGWRQLSEQSGLIVEDAYGYNHHIERRHGVKLDRATRTAEDKKLFDTQLWAAGTTFALRLELVIRRSDPAELLKQALAAALSGLCDGSITLGGRKRRGYGEARVASWRVKQYALTQQEDLFAYLENGDKPLVELGVATTADLPAALGIDAWTTDNRRTFTIEAIFKLDGSLLIRSEGVDENAADFAHLKARQVNGRLAPVLPGTSLSGALRARAHRIVNTIGDAEKGGQLIYDLFGPDMDDPQVKGPRASRLLIRETVIAKGIADLVQNRVGIDRFTGGARDTALFSEQPIWGTPETEIVVGLCLVNPADADIGLLLLLLKDLWTGDLPLGGESSVGRGRLKGKEATLTLGETVWKIADDSGRLQLSGSGNQRDLQDKYLKALLTEVERG